MTGLDLRHWFLRYGWSLNLVLLTAIAWVAAKMVNESLANSLIGQGPDFSAVASPPEREPEYRLPVESILRRDLFAAAREMPAGGAEMLGGDSASLAETSLRLKLIGIAYIMPEHPQNLATIKNLQDQQIAIYRAGDTVGSEATIRSVEMDRVVLQRPNGGLEELRLEEEGGAAGVLEEERGAGEAEDRGRRGLLKKRPGADAEGIRQVGENQYVVQRAAIEEALGNLNNIVTQAKVIPNFVGEGDQRTVDGFRIYRIIPGSIFQQLGLQNGDIIKSINGQRMDNVEKGLQLLQALRNESRFTITIERQGVPMEKHYEVQ